MKNRSDEELAMRGLVETWGRRKWPGARVVHELVVSDCRVDLAFINDTHIAGVEIKSSRDTLARVEKQMRVFQDHLPEVWLAVAPKWTEAEGRGTWWHSDMIVVDTAKGSLEPRWGGRGTIRRAMTVQMLPLLWRDELYAIARRHRLDCTAKSSIRPLTGVIARCLTGDEIVAGVCRELRARGEGKHGTAFAKASDAPIREPSVPVAPPLPL